ncbi:MAG TPA: type II secretion system F family protein [bacterium]|nr:type II secretion system F family protein [bacterium]
MLIVAIILIFAAFVLISLTVYLSIQRQHRDARVIRKRLNELVREEKQAPAEIPFIIRDDHLSRIPLLNQVLERLNVSRVLARIIRQADVHLKVGELVLLMGILGAIGVLIPLQFGKPAMAPLTGMGAALVPLLFLMMQRGKRLKAFIREFPDAIDMMTSALRAGHAFTRAMQLVAEEAPDPVGIEFRRTFEEYNLGVQLRDVLLNMTGRVESLDLKLFVTAVLLQKETGGNLTEILEKIGYTIRERFKLMGQLRTYTAQGRMSAWIIGSLPIAFVVIISSMSPGYMTPLIANPGGHFMLGLAISLQLVGIVVIRKIVAVRYQ